METYSAVVESGSCSPDYQWYNSTIHNQDGERVSGWQDIESAMRE